MDAPSLALELGHRSTGPARGGGHSTRAHRPRRGTPPPERDGIMLTVAVLGVASHGRLPFKGPGRRLSPGHHLQQGQAPCPRATAAPQGHGRTRAQSGRTTPLGYTLCHCPPLRTCSPVDKSVDILEAFVGMIAPVWPEWRSKSLRQSPARDCPEHSGNSCTQFPCPPSTRLSGGPSRLAVKPLLKTTLCYSGSPGAWGQPALQRVLPEVLKCSVN